MALDHPAAMRQYRMTTAMTLVGALTAFAFAPFKLFFIPYLTLAFLFTHCLATSPRRAFVSGYLFGLGLFGVGLGWLYISIHLFGGVALPSAILLTMLLVLFLALYPALACYLGQRWFQSGRLISLFIIMPGCWTVSEWLRAWVLTGFPWLTIGYSQTDTPLAAYAAIGGIFLVSLLTAVTAAGIAVLWQGQARQRVTGVSIIIIVFATGGGLGQLNWTKVKADNIEAALIQGAIPQRLKWRPAYREPSLALYLSLTQPHWGKDIIIWPETAIPGYYHSMRDFLDGLETLAKLHGSTVLTGLPIHDQITDRRYNSILLLGASRQQYHKQRLVPFGEYLPLQPLLGPIIQALRIPMPDFSPGTSANNGNPIVPANGIMLGLSICYEDIFGHAIIQALPQAELLVNVSNDAWFGNSAAPHQHLQMARMRSMETGRYMLRATNTGISAIIDEKGRIISQSKQFAPGSNAALVKTFTGNTPYAGWGDYPLVLIMLSALAGLALLGKTAVKAKPAA